MARRYNNVEANRAGQALAGRVRASNRFHTYLAITLRSARKNDQEENVVLTTGEKVISRVAEKPVTSDILADRYSLLSPLMFFGVFAAPTAGVVLAIGRMQ